MLRFQERLVSVIDDNIEEGRVPEYLNWELGL